MVRKPKKPFIRDVFQAELTKGAARTKPKMHHKVPHQHKITYDDNGKMHRDSSDTEVK